MKCPECLFMELAEQGYYPLHVINKKELHNDRFKELYRELSKIPDEKNSKFIVPEYRGGR